MNDIFRKFAGAIAIGSILLTQPVGAKPIRDVNASQVAQKDPIPSDFTRDFALHFQDLGIEGSIYIYDANRDISYEYNCDRNTTAFLPASTFKILNSLIALETGAIANDVSILTWDGIERDFPVWNQDFNMRRAFKFSTVWFYQVLARRIGYDRMKDWVTRTGYGNQNIGDATEIDTFWLNGKLRITPQEQIQFLRRWYDNDLPFSEQTIAIVKDIAIAEQTPNYIIRAKTGWALAMQIGWYVGYVEQNENVYFFATNIDMQDSNDLSKRIEVTRRSLKSLGLL